MTIPFSDELISAYLDNELSAEERARVEQRLEKDADLRRLCDEFKALRRTLQSLPPTDPSEDLADRVLRQAERQMLAGDDATSDPDSSPTADTNSASPLSATVSPRRNWRFAAGFVATAAALLLVAALLVDPSSWLRDAPEVAQDLGDRAPAGEVTDADVTAAESPTAGPDTASEPQPTDNLSVEMKAKSLQQIPLEREQVNEFDRVTDGVSQRDGRSVRLEAMGGAGESAEVATPSANSSNARVGSEDVARGFGRGPGGMPGATGNGSVSRAGGMGGAVPPATQPDGKGKVAAGLRDGYSRTPAPDSPPGSPAPDPALSDTSEELRATNAKQLINRLEQNESLLVQVSLPRDMASRFRYPTDKQKPNESELLQALREQLGAHGPSNLESLEPSRHSLDWFFLKSDQEPEQILVVEGTPSEVRESLQRLASRTDVQVRQATPAASRRLAESKSLGAKSRGFQPPANPLRPNAETTERGSPTTDKKSQNASDAARSADETAASQSPAFQVPLMFKNGEPAEAVVHILFRFKPVPTAAAVQESGKDE